jgi:hypothetical protein
MRTLSGLLIFIQVLNVRTYDLVRCSLSYRESVPFDFNVTLSQTWLDIMRPNHNVHLASLIFLSQAYALPQPAIIDKKASDDHALNRQRADSVKQTFQIAWNGYQKYAFPNDELHPISNSFGNPR